MRYLVRVGELKVKIDFYKKTVDEIRQNIDILKTEKASLIWEGKARNAFVRYFDDYISELEDIVYNLVALINFFSSYCDNYGYEYLRLRSKYRNITDWRNENENN